MSERKVLSKYYPPDFDPSKLTRQRKPKQVGPKVITVRLMAPCSMQCTSCGNFIYKGLKFNARKETAEEKYLNITIYRFYIKCPRCSSEITFKTDPKHMDYICEKGAIRNFEPWREYREEETEEQKLDRLEAEAAEKETDVMEELEAKFVDAKAEMAVADALDEIRARNARNAEVARERDGAVTTAEQLRKEEEEAVRKELDAEYKAKLAAYKKEPTENDAQNLSAAEPARQRTEASPPPKKWTPALSGIKIAAKKFDSTQNVEAKQYSKQNALPQSSSNSKSNGLGAALAAYGSESDED